MITKNYTYRALAPDLLKQVDAAIKAAHHYRNKRVELERDKRRRHEDILARLCPDYLRACEQVAEAEEELGRLREQIQELRKLHRSKSPKEARPVQAQVTVIRQQLKQRRAHRKTVKLSAMDNALAAIATRGGSCHQGRCATKAASGAAGEGKPTARATFEDARCTTG
jgi:uncharacterized low-complexity protein